MLTPDGSVAAEQPQSSNATETDFSILTDEQLEEKLNPKETEDNPTTPEALPETPPEQPVTPEAGSEVTAPPAIDGNPVNLEEPAAGTDKDNPPAAPKVDEDLQKRNNDLQKQLENLQALYGRQSNELGKLRQGLPPKPTQEDFETDTVAATEQLQNHNDGIKAIGALEQEAQNTEMIKQNVSLHQTYTPDLGSYVGKIKDMLVTQDNQSEIDANQFASNILLQNPLAVFQLVQRCKAQEKITSLEADVARLSKAPSKAVEQMSKVNAQIPSVTASTGEGSAPQIGLISNPATFSGLSDKEVEAQLHARLKQEKK